VTEGYSLNEWVNHPDTHVQISKIPQENLDDAKLRRFKEKILFIAGLNTICCVFLISIWFIFKDPHNTVAMNSAFGIATGFAGYIMRGKTK
jgi:hypothetical protein